MALRRVEEVKEELRQRLTQALRSGALSPGQRLPSTRDTARELGVNPRVVAAVYRVLEAEGIVEMRSRSGIFMASVSPSRETEVSTAATMIADFMAQAVTLGTPISQLSALIDASIASRRLSAVVLASIADQVDGIARELRDDYGLDARGIILDSIGRGEPLPRALRRAHLIVTTSGSEERVRKLVARMRKPCVVASIRADLLPVRSLFAFRSTVYVVVADPRFGAAIHEHLESSGGGHNISVLVAGRDDLSVIPPDGYAYVTESARERLGRTRLPKNLIPPVRVLAEQSVREILRFVVEQNLATRGSVEARYFDAARVSAYNGGPSARPRS